MLLNPSHYVFYYHWKENPGLVECISLTVDVLILASIFWTGVLLIRRGGSTRSISVAGWLVLILLLWPLNSLLIDYFQLSIISVVSKSALLLIALAITAFGLLIVIVSYRQSVVAGVIILLVILSPLLVVNLTGAVWLRLKYGSRSESFREQRPALSQSVIKEEPRLIWIVFDELQAEGVFVNRDSSLRLPEFDRLEKESITVANAYPPAGETMISIPSLISGQILQNASPFDGNDLVLTNEGGATLNWRKLPSVFSDAKKEGFSTGIAGWYHPYCRVIGQDLDFCDWTPQIVQSWGLNENATFGRAMLANLITASLRIPFVFRFFRKTYEANQEQEHARELANVTDRAEDLLSRKIDLVLLHFPIPHSPWLSDSSPDRNEPNKGKGYLGNVVVADEVLGRLRRTLETEGQWDRSIVLVSSDHWWRGAPLVNGKRDHRIPFMLKLADQKVGTEYNGTFNTVLTRKLILRLLEGDIRKPSDAVEWIKRNSDLAETPFTLTKP